MADLERIYEEDFDVRKLSAAQKKNFMKHDLFRFPTALTVILTIITFGIFSWIYFGVIHGHLPKVKRDDFGAAKAILFCLIPIFNIYWHFIYWLRLYDRINFQMKLRKKDMDLPRGLVLAALILSIIPFTWFIGAIFLIVVIGFMQSAINKITEK